MSGLPLADRVVEVNADRGEAAHPRYRFGLGCVVAVRTVLTAVHVVGDAVSVTVPDPRKVSHVAALDPGFVSDVNGRRPDLALVEINDVLISVPAVWLAAAGKGSPAGDLVECCHVIGCLAFMERDTSDGGQIRETADAFGQRPMPSGLARGLLGPRRSTLRRLAWPSHA